MRKLLAVLALAVLIFAPSAPARAASVAEVFEGLTNIHLVVAYGYLQEQPAEGSRSHVLLTANVLGPKLGSMPCYIGGVGVDIRTVDPAFEDIPGAGWSLPFLTCAPWGEQIVVQVGTASDFSAVPELGTQRSYYAGIGFGWNSPNELKTKRIARAKAKQQKALLRLQDEAQGRDLAP